MWCSTHPVIFTRNYSLWFTLVSVHTEPSFLSAPHFKKNLILKFNIQYIFIVQLLAPLLIVSDHIFYSSTIQRAFLIRNFNWPHNWNSLISFSHIFEIHHRNFMPEIPSTVRLKRNFRHSWKRHWRNPKRSPLSRVLLTAK